MQTLEDIKRRTKWFLNDRFGMFIHWGLYSIPARGEWVRSNERMSIEDYEQFFEEFNPESFNPKKWAKIAKKAGMKYMVLTAKHHDGFCLFDTEYTDYKSTNTKLKKDFVKEYVEATRSEGLKVGLYFSLLDWHHKNFPKYNDLHHPLRQNESVKDEEIDFDEYLTFMHNQVRELLTKYGKIDIIWFDFSYDKMNGETWKAQELIDMVRKYQPDIIIDNRLEGSGEYFGTIMTDEIKDYAGDFISPEQALPYEGIKNFKGESLPWELCLTMNRHWGYSSSDKDFKSHKQLVRKLVECVSKGGNMLLNVGPDSNGNFPPESKKILKKIGKWMDVNHESIYGCTKSSFDKPEWGYYTQKDKNLYAHVFDGPIGPLPLVGIDKNQIESVRLLSDGSELKISDSWTIKAYDITFIEFPYNFTPSSKLNDIDTVIRIKLK